MTNDIETTNFIIKATNRQTEVKLEAFESLSPFHKTLEEFYATFGKRKTPRLYYERRSKQYDSRPIKKDQIVSLAVQVNSFLAMFLNEPHSTHRYYGELLEAYQDRIFVENHSPFPYYVSGYGLNILEHFFVEGQLDRFYKQFKYQLLMLFRLEAEKTEIPYLNSKKIDKYCSNLLNILTDELVALKIFRNTTSVVQNVLDSRKGFNPREAKRIKVFTSKLIDQVAKIPNQSTSYARVAREQGNIIWFSDIKGFGFINSELRDEDVFVHYSAIQASGYRYLAEGDIVEFTVVEGNKGLNAQNVTVLTHHN